MKKNQQWILMFLLLLSFALTGKAQHAHIGGYDVYYGNLHNHCAYSDGTGTVTEAYQTAKFSAGFDFFSLSDHAEMLSNYEWNSIKNTAALFNEEGVFAALWAFEWSSITDGHLIVVGSDNYTSSLSILTNSFDKLNNWLNTKQCVAFLNHPGDFNIFNNEFDHFHTLISDNIVGMELWNENNGFDRYYYNDGYTSNDGGLGYYDEALIRGWKTGAAGAEDNHSATWGSGQFRLAILANTLNVDTLMNAMKLRRFYSTLDKNLEMSFKINTSEMGSVLDPGLYEGEIRLHDADNEIFTKAELIHNGMLSETFVVSESDPVISFSVMGGKLDYFYIVVTQEDGDQAISSPIFFSNNEPVAISGSLGNNENISIRYTSDGLPWIEVSENISGLTLIISDMSGRTIANNYYGPGENLLILKTLPAGFYILSIKEHPELGNHKILFRK
jgi:hypothetical protein